MSLASFSDIVLIGKYIISEDIVGENKTSGVVTQIDFTNNILHVESEGIIKKLSLANTVIHSVSAAGSTQDLDFKSQEDYYLAVTQNNVKLDRSYIFDVYNKLSKACEDAEGYIDLPRLVSTISAINILLTSSVEQNMGCQIRDEVVTLLVAMLPETEAYKKTVENTITKKLEG